MTAPEVFQVRDGDGWEVYVTNPAGGWWLLGDVGGYVVVDTLPDGAEAMVAVPEWEQAEQLFRDRDSDHAWNHRCDESDVRCLDCDLRYGERQDYLCHGHGAHSYSDAELTEARRCDDDCPPWSRFHAAEGGDRRG